MRPARLGKSPDWASTQCLGNDEMIYPHKLYNFDDNPQNLRKHDDSNNKIVKALAEIFKRIMEAFMRA